MKIEYIQIAGDTVTEFPCAHSYPVFTAENSPVQGFYAMQNCFYGEEYPPMGIHSDHEGFYVLKGIGQIKIGDAEYEIGPGTAICVPAGVPHGIKKSGTEDLQIFLYHFPK